MDRLTTAIFLIFASLALISSSAYCDHFQTAGGLIVSHSLLVEAAHLNGDPVEAGDEIGVFTPG